MARRSDYSFIAQHPASTLQSWSTRRALRCCSLQQRVFPVSSASFSDYNVFISHAGEDKITIAFPLRDKLTELGIKAFVDERDMPGGTWAEEAMTEAMKTATVAVVVLSPEFVAREWPMRELLCFLRRIGRTQEPLQEDERPLFAIIPLFYRLSIEELYQEPRFDRVDAEGKPLYNISRFFERQANGEPEANVEIMKDALRKVHGPMGVENYVNATNESTSKMNKRREDLLSRLFREVQGAVNRANEGMPLKSSATQAKADKFRYHYHEEKKKVLSGLVLDFVGAHGEDEQTTSTEADVLQTVLDTSKNAEVVSIHGIGGVGKSSILQGLSSLDAVKERYRDGIHLLPLGPDMTRVGLIEALCKVVKTSGGEEKAEVMRKADKFTDVCEVLRSWFAGKEVLFMVDNIWQTAEISSKMIEELLTLHESGLKSKILFTTRSTEIAFEAESFLLQPRKALSSQCRGILILHAGIQVDESDAECNRAVKEILTKCGGLPLFLRIAGKAVKGFSRKPGLHNKGSVAYNRYASKLHLRLAKFLHTPVGSYKRLSSTLEISVQLVEDRKDGWGFRVHLTAAEMYRRLSALPKNSAVPMTTLEHLWELQSEDQAFIVAEEFEQIGLVTLEAECIGMDSLETLRLHDSLHEYAFGETRRIGEEKLGHMILLEGYGRVLENADGCRTWWSRRLETDGYIHNHLCRHLWMSGREGELINLLLKPEWTIRCFDICGMLNLERDYGLGIKIATKLRNDSQDVRDGTERAQDITTALQMISDATGLSFGYNIGHPRELCFQLYGRLNIYAEENETIRKFLGRLEEKGKKLCGPWLRCLSSFLTSPGGAMTRIFDVGSRLQVMTCMVMSDDGTFVYCGFGPGNVKGVAVNLKSGEILKFTDPHPLFSVRCMMLSDDGRLLYSVSAGGIINVWDTQTRALWRTIYYLQKPVRPPEKVKAVGYGRIITEVFTEIGGTGKLKVWDVETGRLLLDPFKVHDSGSGITLLTGAVTCMTMMPDGEHFVSGGLDKTVRIWSAKSGKQLGDAFIGHQAQITCVSVSSNGRHIVSGSSDFTLRIWDIETRTQVGIQFKGDGRPLTCAISDDGTKAASASIDNRICVWDVASGEVSNTLTGHSDTVTGIVFHPGDDSIISSSDDGSVRVWDVNKLRRSSVERRGDRYRSSVDRIWFTSDGKHVIAASYDHSMRVWETESGREIGNTLSGHSDTVSDVAVTTDRQRIISVSSDKTVRIWDFESHKLLHTLTGHTRRIDCVELTPRGDQALTSSPDGTIRVWDLAVREGGHFVLNSSCTEPATPTPSHDFVQNSKVFVTNDGLRVVGVFPGKIFVWDLETRRCVRTEKMPEQHSKTIGSMSRKEVMDLVGETTMEKSEAPASFSYDGQRIWYIREKEKVLLGILETWTHCWATSPDKKTICAGLPDGQLVFMKLEI